MKKFINIANKVREFGNKFGYALRVGSWLVESLKTFPVPNESNKIELQEDGEKE